MTRSVAAKQTYESYKDSGIDWIGDIPEHWGVEKLKYLFYEKKHLTNMSLSCGSISFGEVIEKDDEKVMESTKRSYQEVLSGEFLLNPLNLNYDLKSLRIALSNINVVVSAGYIVLKKKSDIDKQYFKYLLHRFDVAHMKLMGAGVRQTINFGHIANSLLLLPSSKEQQAIANFLDEKTAQIDQAINIKEQQITLLKERKQIIIQNAVTKGLDPNVPMKDSGVDWIGEIPAHWDVKKLKYVLNLKSVRVSSKDSELRYLGMESIEAQTGKILDDNVEVEGLANYFREGNILFGKLRPYLKKVHLAKMEGICSTEFLVYSYGDHNGEFYTNFMISNQFINIVNSSTYGSKMPRANSEFIGDLKIVVPSKKEQKKIAAYIKDSLGQVDNAINLHQTQINNLKEYKASLINSAVTGKIKVI